MGVSVGAGGAGVGDTVALDVMVGLGVLRRVAAADALGVVTGAAVEVGAGLLAAGVRCARTRAAAAVAVAVGCEGCPARSPPRCISTSVDPMHPTSSAIASRRV